MLEIEALRKEISALREQVREHPMSEHPPCDCPVIFHYRWPHARDDISEEFASGEWMTTAEGSFWICDAVTDYQPEDAVGWFMPLSITIRDRTSMDERLPTTKP
jgi:hypothetical protein